MSMQEPKNKLQKIKNYDWRKLFFELLVVFLGVTAGFLLNSWQLEKKDEILAKKYMQGFMQDVSKNISELKSTVKDDSVWLERIIPKLESIREKTITIDSANAIVGLIASISKAGTQTGTYEDITNSGNLNIISDYAIKKQIVEYHVSMSGVEFVDNYFYEYFGDFVMPFIFKNFSVLAGKFVNPQVIKTNQFANVIAGYVSMVQQRKAAYDDLLEKSYALKADLGKLDL